MLIRIQPGIFFLLTIFLCGILNFFFLQVVLKNGLTGDDWQLLFAYKTFNPHTLNRFLDVWLIRGPYTTVQFYYIGILEAVLGINYQLLQIINIFFKIFASITLFILISRIFKNYLLASTSAIIFTIIHSSAGALSYVVKGTEYLAIGFMNLFFLSYYYCITKNSVRLTLLSSVILFLAFMLAPIRMYPLLGLIPLIEIYLIIKSRNIFYLLKPFIRLIIFYLPIIFFAIGSLGSISVYRNDSVNFINDLKLGNRHFFLAPLQGLGYTLLGNNQLNILKVPASLLGIFLLILSLGFFIAWIKNGRKWDKLFLLSFGSWFAFFFLVSTWIIQGKAFNILDSLHWYLIIPSMGISVFIAGLICLFYERWIKSKRYKYLFMALSVLIIISFVSYYEINRHFDDLLVRGTGWEDQSYMQNQVLNSLDKNQLNVFVYFEGLDDPNNHQYYEVSLNLGYFEYWMLYFKKPNFSGCISYITDRGKLLEAYRISDSEYFESDGLCAGNQYDIRKVKTVYDVLDFRAFLLKDKKIFNITNRVLQELRSKKI